MYLFFQTNILIPRYLYTEKELHTETCAHSTFCFYTERFYFPFLITCFSCSPFQIFGLRFPSIRALVLILEKCSNYFLFEVIKIKNSRLFFATSSVGDYFSREIAKRARRFLSAVKLALDFLYPISRVFFQPLHSRLDHTIFIARGMEKGTLHICQISTVVRMLGQ